MRALAVLLLAAACGGAPAACPDTPLHPDPVAGPAFLWRVQGPVATVWLYGTIHDAGLELVPPVALAALDHATRFASELGDVEPDPDSLRALEMIAHGPGIDQQLGADWWDLVDATRGYVASERLARAKPWYALVVLNQGQKGPKVVAMDTRLAERAAKAHQPIDALETVEVQMTALDSVVTLEDLRAGLHDRKRLRCALAGLGDVYATGDVERITPALVIPRTAEPMLYARNRAWIPTLERYLAGTQPTEVFVAVGLGHMLGEQGLPALLAHAGYTVTRVER